MHWVSVSRKSTNHVETLIVLICTFILSLCYRVLPLDCICMLSHLRRLFREGLSMICM